MMKKSKARAFRNQQRFCFECTKCVDLVESRKTTKWGKPVFGRGSLHAKWMLIGEAPGRKGAGETGQPFYGDLSGDILYWCLSQMKVPAEFLYITNVVKCLPLDEKGNNRTPTSTELRNCTRILEDEIRLIQPERIICLGRKPHNQLLKHTSKGFQLKYPVFYMPHPAYYLRNGTRPGNEKCREYMGKLAEVMTWSIEEDET